MIDQIVAMTVSRTLSLYPRPHSSSAFTSIWLSGPTVHCEVEIFPENVYIHKPGILHPLQVTDSVLQRSEIVADMQGPGGPVASQNAFHVSINHVSLDVTFLSV